jgi:hypothetical protein
MSHFSQIKTKFRNRECLVEALIQLKLPPQVHEVGQTLSGYYGWQDHYTAEIIVSGHTFKARADIGFKWSDTTDSYEVIHDAYETVPRLGGDFFNNKLLRAYGDLVVRAKALDLQEQLGECTITESHKGTQHTLRLTFAGHQQVQQTRR